MNKQSRPKESTPIKVWFVERVFRMHRKIVNCGVEYRDDFMNHSSNMEIGLGWYKKGNNNKWTYDHANHLMVD